MRRIIFVMFLLITILVSCTKINHEKEKNDSFASANLLKSNIEITGYLSSRDDRDFYKVEFENESIVKLELSGVKGINNCIKVWKGQENPVVIKVIDDNRKSSSEEFNNLHVTKGIYFFEITFGERDLKKGNKHNPYKFKITTSDFFIGENESEPNDSMQEATLLFNEKECSGFYSPSFNPLMSNNKLPQKEEDWFKIELNEGEFPLVLNIGLKGIAGIQAKLSLLDSNGKIIVEKENDSSNQDITFDEIGIKKAGVYYLKLFAKGFSSNIESPYFIKYSVAPYTSNLELENNNDIENANIFVGDFVNGKVNSNDDKDFFLYKLNLKPGESNYKITLENPDSSQLGFNVYDNNGVLLFETGKNISSFSKSFPLFNPKHDFFVEVFGKGQENGQKYALHIEPLPKREYEIEPNDKKQDATLLVANKEIFAFKTKYNDTDYFLIKTGKDGFVNFVVKGIENGSLTVSITDPNGYIIQSYSVKGDEQKEIKAMVNQKAFLIVKPDTENFNNFYSILLK